MTDGSFPIYGEVEDAESLRRQERSYAALAASARRLADAVIRTRVDPARADEVAADLDALADRLLVDAVPGPLGPQLCSDGILRDHANPAVGLRNPLAPPLVVEKDRDAATARTDVVLGAAYEGPPGLVHGGIIALVLDQVLGTVPALAGLPGMTASLALTYRRPTPLGRIGAHAWIAERDGWKVTVRGVLTDAGGATTVEAEGLFVVPRHYRSMLAQGEAPPSDVGEYPAT